MRLLLVLLLFVIHYTATAQSRPEGVGRAFPAKWVPLLHNLTKLQVDTMQASANDHCRSLNYVSFADLYKDVSDCTLVQATAILSVDGAISDLEGDPPTKFRPKQVKKCWAIYRALGSRDVENLAHCFGDIQHFELLQSVANAPTRKIEPMVSSYCEKVAQTSGGSYVILEECIKQENAARRRLGR